ncbi:MAG: mannose-1-phosphate guanylyltransferase/mannose-6-phosphate isomerase [Deltaproteobacteria bacterium]|nr:mannose-1-phosphate guanylyltransferase/mannose-6-phosphate isomerase [Deltaproteobacteria bacterium]
MIIPVILAGGSGKRLWPLSRANFPKQIISFDKNQKTFFQDTVLRLKKSAPIVLCNNSQRFFIKEQLESINISAESIILEPCSKNTAPAIVSAAHKALQISEDPILLVMPSDHFFQNNDAFYEAVAIGEFYADAGYIVALGSIPTYPTTAFGYIEKGNTLFDHIPSLKCSGQAASISSFVEKPDIISAKKYIKTGNYFWNSGIFIFKASVIRQEFNKFAPQIYNLTLKAVQKGYYNLGFFRIDKDLYSQCPNISIDYTVMEKTDKGVVVTFNSVWNDIGTWDNIWRFAQKDENDNVAEGDVILMNVKNSYVHSTRRLIAAYGIEDIIAVETSDAVLIAKKEVSHNIKNIVDRLEALNREEVFFHKKVYRPWGMYEIIDSGEKFLVKKIIVNSNSALSLQKHNCRAEHWTVVKGQAVANRGGEEFIIKENESIYIPAKVIHSLKNLQKTSLEIIEIQSGEYIGEDDIIRFEDKYGRITQ